MGVNATLLIKNGHVHDGTGAPAFHGDIAIDGETIVAVGDPGTLHVSGEPRVIDAEGMLVCPALALSPPRRPAAAASSTNGPTALSINRRLIFRSTDPTFESWSLEAIYL